MEQTATLPHDEIEALDDECDRLNEVAHTLIRLAGMVIKRRDSLDEEVVDAAHDAWDLANVIVVEDLSQLQARACELIVAHIRRRHDPLPNSRALPRLMRRRRRRTPNAARRNSKNE